MSLCYRVASCNILCSTPGGMRICCKLCASLEQRYSLQACTCNAEFLAVAVESSVGDSRDVRKLAEEHVVCGRGTVRRAGCWLHLA